MAAAPALRRPVLLVVWAAGLLTAFAGVLASATRFGCRAGDPAVACTSVGSSLGVAVVVAAVVVVTATTALARGRERARLLQLAVVALVLLTGCYLVAQAVMDTH